jgi:hypothetical protein
MQAPSTTKCAGHANVEGKFSDREERVLGGSPETRASRAFQALFEGKETRVTELRASMGSKFLYFASSSLAGPFRSLINDENVYHAMKLLGLDVAADPHLAYTDEYVRTVSWMHGAASDVNSEVGAKLIVSGDDVEYALFQYESWKRRKDRLEGISVR